MEKFVNVPGWMCTTIFITSMHWDTYITRAPVKVPVQDIIHVMKDYQVVIAKNNTANPQSRLSKLTSSVHRKSTCHRLWCVVVFIAGLLSVQVAYLCRERQGGFWQQICQYSGGRFSPNRFFSLNFFFLEWSLRSELKAPVRTAPSRAVRSVLTSHVTTTTLTRGCSQWSKFMNNCLCISSRHTLSINPHLDCNDRSKCSSKCSQEWKEIF